jgi:hypothetical protein
MSSLSTMTALSLLASSIVSAAEPIAMFTPKAFNVDEKQLSSFGAVCANRYARVTQAPVISPEVAATAIGPNGSLVDAAVALHAHEVIELTVINLATASSPGRWLIEGVRRGIDGKELYRAQVTAESLDDAVPACERMALSLSKRVPPEETANRNNVTAAEMVESGAPNRISTEKLIGVKTNFALPLSATGGGVNPVMGVAFDARFEHPRYFIEIGAGLLIPAVLSSSNTSYGGLTSEIGASYFLSDADTAAYLGGGLQPRILFSGSVVNLAPYAQLGVEFSRLSSTRLYADARVSQNIFPVGTTSFSTGSTSVYPTELALQLGIGW